MVEAPTIGAKIVPSRDQGYLIDDGLSLDSFRVGCMAAAAALGQKPTFVLATYSHRLLLVCRQSCQRDMPTFCEFKGNDSASGGQQI
jgi:predicted naringenin-chalcone synthase